MAQATEALRITGEELMDLNVVDEVIRVSSSLSLETFVVISAKLTIGGKLTNASVLFL